MTGGVRPLLVLATLVALGGCSGGVPTTTPTDPSPTPIPSEAATASASPTASGIVLPEPGRPFDADMILAAMETSRRPGGVPDELQTEAVAAEVASAIWTIDGRPWDRISIGGSCAADRCSLEVAGAHPGAEGEDAWVFDVVPADEAVVVDSVTLRSLPASLTGALDAAVRTAHPAPDARGLLLTALRWQPPPADSGRFELSYRTGNETGCALEIVFDAEAATVVEESAAGC